MNNSVVRLITVRQLKLYLSVSASAKFCNGCSNFHLCTDCRFGKFLGKIAFTIVKNTHTLLYLYSAKKCRTERET